MPFIPPPRDRPPPCRPPPQSSPVLPGVELNITNANNCTGPPLGLPGHPGPPICGNCNMHCVFTEISLVFVIGVVANIIVISRVARDRELHTVTFLAIGGLALADTANLSVSLLESAETVYVVNVCTPWVLQDAWQFYEVKSILWKNATFHIAHLAVVRYIILVHPFKARTLLTKSRVLLSLALVWVLAVAFHAITVLLQYYFGLSVQQSVHWFLSYLVPFVFTVGLHTMKIVHVRLTSGALRTRAQSDIADKARRKRLRQMARVTAVVLASELILPLPQFIIFLMDTYTDIWIQNPNLDLQFVVKGTTKLMYFATYTINPFIYAFLSPQFRTSIRKMMSRNG